MGSDGEVVEQETEAPKQDVEVFFVQGGVTETLATVDADAEGTYEVTVEIPADALAGDATITLDDPNAQVAEISVTER